MSIFPALKATITHLGIDTDYLTQGTIRSVENGVDTASIILEDRKAELFDHVSRGDAITLKDSSSTTRLNGAVYRVDPIVTTKGSFLKLECDGAGYGLDSMLCNFNYGAETGDGSLDTIKEIIEDDTYGVIDKYVNKILGSADDSGFSYTTQVETVAGAIPFAGFLYKKASKCINDLCDIVQAIKGTSAGVHWRVDPSNNFILATVGAHGTPANTYWSTYWNSSQADSTFTEGVHFSECALQQLPLTANYVVYQGRFSKPANGDFWTENQSALWGTNNAAISDDNAAGYFVVNDYSIQGDFDTGADADIYYPSTEDLGLDFTGVESEKAVPSINFYWRKNNYIIEANTAVRLCTTDFETDYFQAKFCEYADDDFQWAHASIPVGNYWNTRDEGRLYRWTESGSPDWSDINVVTFHTHGVTDPKLWIDNLHFEGLIIRIASQTAGYSSVDPCRMSFIVDEQAKDDSLNASDDSGTMARLCYAEYLRSLSTPYVGTLEVGLRPEIVGGQLLHLEAKKTSSGTYKIDSDFRIQRAIHNFIKGNVGTTLEITSDVTNSLSKPVPNTVNSIYESAKQADKDRQAASTIRQALNALHPVLEKTY
jgi:hypothetical protein